MFGIDTMPVDVDLDSFVYRTHAETDYFTILLANPGNMIAESGNRR